MRKAPLKMTRVELGWHMRKLVDNPDFQVLQSLWLTERTKCIEEVKEKKSPEACAKLEGFDAAIGCFERWAGYEPKGEGPDNSAAQALQEANSD